MKFFASSPESEAMARSVTKNSQVVFIPAFTGLGAPHWKMDARGAIFGLTRDTTREEITLAALKSIALQSRDLLIALEKDTGKNIIDLRADGGAVKNSMLMQYQADILGIPVLIPENTESTALGAAYLAGIGAGLYKTVDEVAKNNIIIHSFQPAMEGPIRDIEIARWSEAVGRLLI
jgi:glycerol kinase